MYHRCDCTHLLSDHFPWNLDNPVACWSWGEISEQFFWRPNALPMLISRITQWPISFLHLLINSWLKGCCSINVSLQHQYLYYTHYVLEIISVAVTVSGMRFKSLVKYSVICCAAKSAGGRNLWSAHRLDSLKGVQIRTIASGCMACHSVVISADGKVYSWGMSFLPHDAMLARYVLWPCPCVCLSVTS